MKVIAFNKKYRLIEEKYNNFIDEHTVRTSYKVQVKFIFLWITVKEFNTTNFDEDSEFCMYEAVDLYNKIINPYGRF